MQDAGAIAVIIANNVAGAPPAMAGVDPTITISSVSVSLADGNAIKANPVVNASLGVDSSRRAGTLATGYARLYAPNPDQPGSSISHWDTLMFPNQLMEPAINPDLTHSVEPPQDMTLPQLRDVGWFPDGDFDGLTDVTDACLGSNLAPTVVIQTCDSQVPNALFTNGCTMSDRIASCVSVSRNHGQFVKCVTDQANSYKKAGIITGAQKDAIVNCAINSTLP